MLKNASLEFRLKWIRKSVCFFFLMGIILSFKLWISNRFFPLAPVFDNFSGFNSPLDLILICALLLTLGLGIIFSDRLIYSTILFLLLILALQDQNRWQAWVFIYALMLIPYTFQLKDEKALLNYLQIIFVGVYIWSGIQKLNPNFPDITFQRMLTGFFGIKDPLLVTKLKSFGYIIPAVEIFIGTSFLIPRLRNIGVILTLVTHAFILLFLSPLGINSNSVVYPWNVAMMVFVFLLFFGMKNKIVIWQKENFRAAILTSFVVFLTWILPFLNFFGCWDNYLSFSLYSDKLHSYFIVIDDSELDKVDPRLEKYLVQTKGVVDGRVINVTSWSLGEMNSPIYPETRVFKKVCKTLCGKGMAEENLIFMEYEYPYTKNKFRKFHCQDILK